MSKIIEYHLPSQLTSIGANAYQGCTNLKSLNIPENLQTIGDYAFAGCYQISSIVDKRLTAQTVSTNTFGNTTGTGTNAYTGYQTKGNNVLLIYSDATGYDENIWDDPLQNTDKCGFIQQYINIENVDYHAVTFDAGIGSISVSTRLIVKGKKIGELPEPICPVATPYFGGWYTAPNGGGDRITKDYIVNSDITLYALYSAIPFASYKVILNDQWQASTIANPDSNQYDGVYESFSNYNVHNQYAKMYIRISGYTSFTIYIRSNAESNYDYTLAFNLDVDYTSTTVPSDTTSGVKAHTSGKQNSGITIESYTKVEYTGIDGGDHFICVIYRKDGSASDGTDRGYVLIENPSDLITINFDLNGGTLTSGSLTATGYQGKAFDNSVCPVVNGPSSKPYFIGWNDKADGSGTTYNSSTILPMQSSITLYAQYIAENPVDPNKDIYLCFTAEQANSTIKMTTTGSAPTVYLETSTTGNIFGWSDFTVGSTTITLTNVGDKVYFRAKQDNRRFAANESKCNYFVMTGKIAASGNLNTLLKADGSVLDLTGRDYCYLNIFQGCTSLTQAPELPATTLTDYCYSGMFEGCTSLTSVPSILPATTLADSCYSSMFNSCSSLTQAPELPATTLINYCYNGMFNGCTSLIQAPELPATTLGRSCYSNMFQDCKSLTQAPELLATTLADYCYSYMFNGCTSLTQAPDLPAETLTESCYSGMFEGCTSLTQAPELPAMTLAYACYSNMFEGCTSLTSAPSILPATTLDANCYTSMFQDCTSLTQAPALPATNLNTSCYNSMFEGCTSLTQAPELPATTLDVYCYYGMFEGCTSLTQAPELPATTLYVYCYYSMFSSCKSLTQAPTLPATTLAANCYYEMFYGCSKLNSINVNFSAWEPIHATNNWVKYVASTGTFTCPEDLLETYGTSYIPTGWTVAHPEPEIDCLCFTSEEDGSTVSLVCYDYLNTEDICDSWCKLDYSMDGKTWQTYIDPDSEDETLHRGKVINLNKDETVYFKATLGDVEGNPNLGGFAREAGMIWHYFVMEGSIKADGNIQFLLENTGTKMEVPTDCYNNMFSSCTSLTQAPALPATTLAEYCYNYMFYNCSSLTQAPALPATTLAYGCYSGMFEGCTSLTQAPELPAMTLVDRCYHGMFYGCTSLTQAPELPAMTLVEKCYRWMFEGCTKLNSINVNFSAWNPSNATENWVKYVASTGTFTCPEALPEIYGINNIPTGWTVVIK